jgi:hypothetical protein
MLALIHEIGSSAEALAHQSKCLHSPSLLPTEAHVTARMIGNSVIRFLAFEMSLEENSTTQALSRTDAGHHAPVHHLGHGSLTRTA